MGRAICYSGYRAGQSPDAGRYPSYQEVHQDLRLLARHWRVLRLYDCSPHAELVLEVIRRERLDLAVLLGAWLAAETDNPGCPWGGVHGEAQLARNVAENGRELDRLVDLARRHPEVVVAVSVGNEACVDWTDHLVPPARVLGYVRQVKRLVPQPVTVCDNYVPWCGPLDALAGEVDFISLHSYPAWEAKPVGQALPFTEANWWAVAERFPGTPVVVTEAGWTTRSGGRGVRAEDATPENQATYLAALDHWSRTRGVLTFVFEAFDEAWKGSPDPLEPEKHWGVFTEDRRPKVAVQPLFPDLAAAPP
ncbi:MAG: glycosyl hydrolase [Anaeromyxobacter sp.]|nr:glycosyl hydrolase [Anaeromyxobacter sp.]